MCQHGKNTAGWQGRQCLICCITAHSGSISPFMHPSSPSASADKREFLPLSLCISSRHTVLCSGDAIQGCYTSLFSRAEASQKESCPAARLTGSGLFLINTHTVLGVERITAAVKSSASLFQTALMYLCQQCCPSGHLTNSSVSF